MAATIIDAVGLGDTVRIDSGEGSDSVLKGFTITGATGDFNRGIVCAGASISNCKIIENEYGIFCCCEDANLSINNCIIQSNVVIGLVLSGSETLSNCVVQNNGSIGVGFGYYDGTMTNCTIYDNGDYGVCCDYDSSPIIKNCTIVNNEPGGLYVDDSSSVTVYNSILWDNSPDQIDGAGTATVTFSCVEDGHAGTGNIDDDPCFVNSAAEDYRINPDSRCIDAGTDNGDMPAFDIVGTERLFDYPDVDNNGAELDYDMGAYEAVSMVGFWKLDEGSGDEADDSSLSENDHNGDVGGDPVWKPGGGVMYGALQFDGNGDFINIRNPGDYNTSSDFTWSAWMRTLETDGDDKVITTGGVIMAKCPDSGTNNVRCLHVINGGDDDGKLRFNLGTTAILSSGKRVDDGLWHLVAVTVKFESGDDTVKLYVDGKVETTICDMNADETDFLRIGYANSQYYDATTANYFEGRIDDVRVYNYVLTLEQINDIYEKSGYWRFVVTCDSRGTGPYDQINEAKLREIATAVVDEKAEVFMFPGDLVFSGSETWFDNWRDELINKGVYAADIKVMPIRGNHEIMVGGTTTHWVNVFDADIDDNGPSGETNLTYYKTHKNAIFIALDLYVGDRERHYVNQTWLDTTLSANTKKHVFVATHEPAFKVRTDYCLHKKPDERNAFWESLENEAGCRLYFCGHDHFYDHAWIDNGDGNPNTDVHQMVVGTAGAPLYIWYEDWEPPNDPEPYQEGTNSGWVPKRVHYRGKEDGTSNYGYEVVEVWGDNVTTHWKLRNAPSSYLPDGDVFEYSVP